MLMTRSMAPPERLDNAALPRRRHALIGWAALAAIPLILLLLGMMLARDFQHAERLRADVDRSYQARLHIQRVLSLHQDIETGQRGYVMTGAATFLEPYDAARGQIGRSLTAVETELGDPGRSVIDIARLRGLSAAKLEFTERTVRLRRAGLAGEAESLIASGRGKALMDEIRRHIRQIDAAEEARLRQAMVRADQARAASQRNTIGLLLLLGLLLFGASWANNRSNAQKEKALVRERDQKVRQETIFESAKDGIIMLDESGRIQSLNSAAARMYGYSSGEMIGRDVGFLFEVPPEQKDVEGFLKRLQRRRKDDVGRIQEFWGTRSDGTTFPGDVAVSPVRLDEGLHYVAIVRDVTERKQIEQMKSEFVATVSHELRTPLTSIAGSLGLLAGGAAGDLPERARRLIKIAHSNSERLVRLINDILDIEKIQSEKMTFDVQPLRLRSLLDQAVQANRPFADSYGVQIVLEPGQEQAMVLADPDRLAQVMTNLLSNACKFSPRGETVLVWIQPLEGRYRITVSDQGPGIPDEFRSRIFSKFAQADASDTRQKEGTGLGLSIVKEIVNRLGGSVAFDSAPGAGTSFHVELPAHDDGKVDGRPSLSQILQIAVESDVIQRVATGFKGIAEVRSVDALEGAYAALSGHRFDILVIDPAVANGSGSDLIEHLRRSSSRSAPILLFPARPGAAELSAQTHAILVNPPESVDNLVATVQDLLARRHERRAGAKEA